MKIAINPMPVFDHRFWNKINLKKNKAYVTQLAQFVDHLVNRGHEVTLFNNHPRDLQVIEEVHSEIQKHSADAYGKVEIVINETVQGLVTTISESDVVVATRFHATVLPLRLGKPVIGICYYWKSKELLKDVGLDQYHVDINDFTGRELSEKFDFLSENIDSAKEKLNIRYRQYSVLMDEQWDRLEELIRA